MDTKHVILPAAKELKAIFDFSPVLTCICDKHHRAYYVNDAWLSFVDEAETGHPGSEWRKVLHPDDRENLIEQIDYILSNPGDFKIKCRLKHRDGEYRWTAMHGVPAHSPQDGFSGCVISALDIHDLLAGEQQQHNISLEGSYEREQALNEELAATNEEMSAANEELLATNEDLLRSQNDLAQLNADLEQIVSDRTTSLEESQHRTRKIIETAPFPIGVYVGREMRIEFANKAITDVWGKGEDVIGKLYTDVLPELENQDVFAQLDSVFTTGVPFHAENQRIDLVVGGVLTPFYFNYSFTALYDREGKIYGVMNTAANITDLVQAKLAVDRSEKELYNLILQSPVAMCVLKGPEHVVTVANEMMISLWGKPAHEVMQKPIFDGLPEVRAQKVEQLLNDVYQTGESYRAYEQPVSLVRNGTEEVVYQNFIYEAHRDFSGKIIGVIATTIDVTEQVTSRKLLENSYQEQQGISEELAASNEELASTIEELTTINEDLTEAQERLYRSEKLFKSIALNIPDSLVIVIDKAQRLLTLEGDLVDKLGYSGQDIKDKQLSELSGEGYGLFRGLDERVLAGERASVERQNAAAEDFIIHLVPLKDDQNEIYAGLLIALDITRIKRAELQSAKLAAIVHTSNDAIVSKSLDGVISSWNKSAERIFGFTEEEMVGASILKLIPPDRQDEEPLIIARIKAGERVEHFETKRMRMDGSMIDVSLSISPIRDSRGNIIGVSKIARDISEKKLEEIRKNDFIGMVSHELKTPLTSLTALIQVLNMKLKAADDPFVTGASEKATVQVKKMAKMINGFLNVSRLESGQLLIEKRKFEMRALIKELIGESQLVFPGSNIRFEAGEEISLNADSDKIGSVISNLIGNAIKYSDRGSPVTVSCNRQGGNVQVSVRDEGIGIDKEHTEKLFERYFRVETTDTRHISGFGIGLYVSSEVIRRHGGRIWVESEPGKGSTFHFTLPGD
jgi:PAS domain S-box-containing protein